MYMYNKKRRKYDKQETNTMQEQQELQPKKRFLVLSICLKGNYADFSIGLNVENQVLEQEMKMKKPDKCRQ